MPQITRFQKFQPKKANRILFLVNKISNRLNDFFTNAKANDKNPTKQIGQSTIKTVLCHSGFLSANHNKKRYPFVHKK